MLRLKRGILAVLVLILLPLAPARAQTDDDILWRGTVTVQRVYSARLETPTEAGPTLYGWTEIRYTTRITALGTGSAQAETTYRRHESQQVLCPHEEPPYYWIDNYVVNTEARALRPPMSFSVFVTDSVAWIEFIEPGIVVTDHHDNPCGQEPTETYRAVSYASSPLYHNGEFSSDSTEIYGYADAGSYYNPNPAPASGWESETYVTVYNLSGTEEDTRWLKAEGKAIFWESSEILSRTAKFQILSALYQTKRGRLHRAGGHAAVSISASTAALIDGLIALDPPDPNFTEIAVPVTPSTSQQPILTGDDFTQAQADAFNAFLTNLQQGVGLGRAILTSFNRASGAQQANDSYWIEQQLQAARVFAGQYADILDARPQILENMKQTFLADPGEQFDITSEDIAQYQYDLIINGLSPEQDQLLTELGLDARGKAEVLHAMIQTEFPGKAMGQEPVAQFPDLLTDPELTQTTQELVVLLREYAAGEGWKIYTPMVTR